MITVQMMIENTISTMAVVKVTTAISARGRVE